MNIPFALSRHTLSFRDPMYEYTRRYGAPSVYCAKEYTVIGPCAEYQMINGRVVVLYWDRPYRSAHGGP